MFMSLSLSIYLVSFVNLKLIIIISTKLNLPEFIDDNKKHKGAETEKAKEKNPIKFCKTHDFAASENICSCTEQILNWFDEI